MVFKAGDLEALLFEPDAARDEFAAAQRDDIGQKEAQFAKFLLGVAGGGSFGGGGHTKGSPLDEAVE